MKTVRFFGKFLFASLSLLALSCSSDSDDGGGGGTPTTTTIKAKVNGSQYQTFSIQGTSVGVATSTGTGSGRLIMITGSNDMGGTSAFSINLIGIDATGEYAINPDSDSTLAFVMNNSGVSYDTSDCAGATGTINITMLTDEVIKGTFSFTGKDDENCTDSKTITEGSFSGVFM